MDKKGSASTKLTYQNLGLTGDYSSGLPVLSDGNSYVLFAWACNGGAFKGGSR